MFPSIPKEEVLAAVDWIHSQMVAHKKTRGRVSFFLAYGNNRKADNLSSGCKAHFLKLAYTDVARLLAWDLYINDVFLCLSSVIAQGPGVPMGGSCSAQEASLTLIKRELAGDTPKGLTKGKWLR